MMASLTIPLLLTAASLLVCQQALACEDCKVKDERKTRPKETNCDEDKDEKEKWYKPESWGPSFAEQVPTTWRDRFPVYVFKNEGPFFFCQGDSCLKVTSEQVKQETNKQPSSKDVLIEMIEILKSFGQKLEKEKVG